MASADKVFENREGLRLLPIDFTALPKRNKAYAGANGSKICVVYEDEQYMLKFPPIPGKNKEMSYSNSCFSEYLGCQIYEIAGIPVQKTLLGTYCTKGKVKIVVACGDFTRPGIVLQDFASHKNEDCNRALQRIVPRLDMSRIETLIEGTPFLSELQKRFYIIMLTERKEIQELLREIELFHADGRDCKEDAWGDVGGFLFAEISRRKYYLEGCENPWN